MRKQCEILRVSRSSLYYEPVPTDPEELVLMRRIDALHLIWRSLKYEEVYLVAYDDTQQARASIGRCFNFYNLQRQHQALGYQTPDAFYRSLAKAAGSVRWCCVGCEIEKQGFVRTCS